VAVALASLLALASAAQGIFLEKKQAPTSGEWSAEAVYLGYGLGALDRPGELRVSRVASPDGRRVAVLDHLKLTVLHENRVMPGLKDVFFPPLGEVLWSGDSQAFAITSSDGGYVGTWRPRVFLIRRGTVRELELHKQVIAEFSLKSFCEKPGDLRDSANIVAVRWIAGSAKLLMAAEVPSHSSCRDMGSVTGFIVEVPSGKILERLTWPELRTQWGRYLGERLAGHRER